MPRKVRLEGLRLEVPRHPDPDITKEYELISPLWGGGERPNRRDSVMGIRPSSIKGQLRFWWRAVRGWRAGGNLKKLLELEEKIWGGVTKVKQGSRVRIEVELIKPNSYKDFEHLSASSPGVPGYVVFPLVQGRREEKEDQEKALSKEGIRFRLRIWLDPLNDKEITLKEEVEAALWAWETFGGIGARTRRGFGAVALLNADAPVSEDLIKGNLKEKEKGVWPEDVPHLTASSPIAVLDKPWQEVVELYQRFRQYRPGAKRLRNGKAIPGPNKWPEPALIRWAYEPHRRSEPPVQVAPRAQFGLPVPFFFLQEKKKLGKGGKLRLTGKEEDRLASPLVIRPLRGSRTLVAVLEGPRTPPGGVRLDPEPRARALMKEIRVEMNDKTAQKLVESGLRVLEVGGRVYSDPVRAFWECLQDDACVGLLNEVDLGGRK